MPVFMDSDLLSRVRLAYPGRQRSKRPLSCPGRSGRRRRTWPVYRSCALAFDNVTTVPKALVAERITCVPDARLGELCGALRAAAGC
jgi:mRNA-degrading endonuclease toxin of MazEF toxin-antitoxin module